jgi:methyl-accepting chemotaxis protein
MSLWLIALIVSAVVVVGATVHLVRRGLELYRALRDSGGAIGEGALAVAEAAEQTAAKAERLAEDTERMADAVERLQSSRARLNVLTQAIRDVQDSVGRLTALAPRK